MFRLALVINLDYPGEVNDVCEAIGLSEQDAAELFADYAINHIGVRMSYTKDGKRVRAVLWEDYDDKEDARSD